MVHERGVEGEDIQRKGHREGKGEGERETEKEGRAMGGSEETRERRDEVPGREGGDEGKGGMLRGSLWPPLVQQGNRRRHWRAQEKREEVREESVWSA